MRVIFGLKDSYRTANIRQIRTAPIGKAHRGGYILAWCGVICLAIFFISSCAHAENTHDVDMSIIAQIESSNNPNAYNKRSGAIGLCQVTPIVLADYDNTYNQKHDVEMLYDKEFNLIVSDWYINFKVPSYLRHYGLKDTIENRLFAYNAGIGRVKRGIMPTETKNYILKYNKLKG